MRSEDARKRNEKHRRRKGVLPKAQVNAARNAMGAEKSRKMIKAILEKLPKGMKPKWTKIAEKVGLHRNTVSRHARDILNKPK